MNQIPTVENHDYVTTTTYDRVDPQAAQYLEPVHQTHDIHISPKDYGYVVNIGCQTFAIETTDKLISVISGYLKDVQTTTKNWFDKKELP